MTFITTEGVNVKSYHGVFTNRFYLKNNNSIVFVFSNGSAVSLFGNEYNLLPKYKGSKVLVLMLKWYQGFNSLSPLFASCLNKGGSFYSYAYGFNIDNFNSLTSAQFLHFTSKTSPQTSAEFPSLSSEYLNKFITRNYNYFSDSFNIVFDSVSDLEDYIVNSGDESLLRGLEFNGSPIIIMYENECCVNLDFNPIVKLLGGK